MPIRKVSRQEVLKRAEELAREYGESLTLTAFMRETGIWQSVIFDLFGNWKNLRTAVGLTPEAPRARNKVTKERILELMREQAAIHGERLTERLFREATGLSERVITDRFGSWGKLRQAVGLSPRAKTRQPQYTEEEIIEDLYRVYRSTRQMPRSYRYRFDGGRICPGTIQQRFGSWSAACEALRAHLRCRGELLDHHLWTHFYRDPAETERHKKLLSGIDQP
jgi:hypothetical protein